MNFINTYLKLPIINYSIISEEKTLFSEKKSFVAEKKGESWRIRIFQNKNWNCQTNNQSAENIISKYYCNYYK